jgi:predicted DNA-binding transcriptional regulator AlpA
MTTQVTNSKSNLIYSKELEEDIPIPADPFALMSEVQAAAFLGLTRRALQNFRLTGKGPQYVKIGARCVRYRRVDLDGWNESNLRTSTSDEGKE